MGKILLQKNVFLLEGEADLTLVSQPSSHRTRLVYNNKHCVKRVKIKWTCQKDILEVCLAGFG